MFSACSAASSKQVFQQEERSAGEQSKPNILLIVGDDHGYGDLGSTGFNSDVNTPNLDKLANNGIRFTQAYATSPICNTSRAGLITGRYTQRFGGYWYGGNGLEQATEQTLAETLKAQSYATGYVGKFHFGTSHQPGSRNFPTDHGFDSFYGFSGGRKHYLIHNQAAENAFQQSRKAHNKKGEGLEMGPVWLNDSKVDQQGFSTELIGQHANQFIVENKTKPFFLQVSFNAIHNFTHQLPAAYLKQQGLKGYHDWDPATENFRDWYVGGRYPNNPEGRAHYLGQLHFLDVEIGKLLAQLEQQGLMDNTIVVYVGDNGGSTPIYANNGPLRGSKYTLYEGGIRIPMIIYGGKGYQQGQVVTDVVSAMDIYPTVLSAAGIEIPDFLDGQDITPLIASTSDTAVDNNLAARTLIWDSGHEIAVRSGKWKYRAAFDDYYAVKQMVDLELGEYLYDLDADPGESNNIIANYPKVVAQLKAQYQRWAKANVEPKKLSKITKANRLKAGL
ncbi:sulfatase-like hydrolase/transferase [Thalassotalea fonticola]|uniref:Sulfatase-like hydrolase/transferase n=1 Tax=Thalassotalea fonticola TaxID=3065649 RepID=A0ABZ0GKY2_9GAMM|nr:sulfatase-like hydrolase/transferase [Colwelliaceae bacterium S1-1]